MSDKISEAKQLGREANKLGLEAVPVFDDKLLILMTGSEVGEDIPFLEAWLKGWHEANLEPDFWADADIIHTYTRAQAIEDGVLVDVSEIAREAGFKWPVAITAGVWALINDIPPKLEGIQDVEGRLWDVVWMARMAINRGGTLIHYTLIMDRNENGHRVKSLTLKMVSGPGDNWEPVITIMLPDED